MEALQKGGEQMMAWPEIQIALASILLAGIAILVALSAIYGFINIKSKAAAVAREEAKKIAEEIAEKATCSYLQAEIPALVHEHMETFMNDDTLSPAMGDDIAKASYEDRA